MSVLSWLINHPDDKYSAAIIAIECNMTDMSTYMAVLSILEGTNFVEFDEFSEDDLMVGLKKGSSSTKLLLHLKDEFDDCAFNSEQVSPSLAYLYSPELKNTVDSKIFDKFKAEELVDMCKNYKDLNGSEDDVEKEIFNICSRLDEEGEYDDFIEKLENEISK